MNYDYTKLNIGQLDYEGIKANLVAFLKAQPNLASFDFDSPSSSLNIFLDILATNTAYNGFYLHSVLTNAFPATAKTKRSLLLNAGLLGTFISDISSAKCIATIRNTGSLVPAFSTFNASLLNGSPCFFYNTEIIPTTSGTDTVSINLVAGKRIQYFSNFDFTNKVIEIPLTYDPDSFIFQTTTDGINYTSWTKITNYSNTTIQQAEGKVYTVKNGPNVYYVTTNIPGAITPTGVRVAAIEALGLIANNASIINSATYPNIEVIDTTIPSGGRDFLTKDFIRSYITYTSNTKDRIVTQDDYIEAIYQFLLSKNISILKENIIVSSSIPGQINIKVNGLNNASVQNELINSYLPSKKIAGTVLTYGA